MRTYVLFIFGDFEDHDDIVFFVSEIFSSTPSVHSIKYVLEDGNNLILIFESEKSEGELIKDLNDILSIDQVKFYFLFQKEGLITSRPPKNLKDHVFKPKVTKLSEKKIIYDLDELLEKIDKDGLDSLTPEEKYFLDNFGN